jgi:hypothetical protein
MRNLLITNLYAITTKAEGRQEVEEIKGVEEVEPLLALLFTCLPTTHYLLPTTFLSCYFLLWSLVTGHWSLVTNYCLGYDA